ncbi:DNA ligase [Bradyrhizobium lablabi]|uniref:ATP-dependent DNA ligase n=1 Tax=Bradyrhizobium lablabi TaxID=722472 RepID=UPI0028A211B5|nr:DNA ligase [Bradyrhizobium lablabi]
MCCGVSAQEATGDRDEGALPRLHCTCARLAGRQGAERRALDSRDQVRWLSRPGAPRQRSGEDLHPAGNDWTKRFKKVANDDWHISASSAIVDGEIVVPSANGTTDFWVLQNELRGKSTRIVLVAFDLLYLNGRDLQKLPLLERKAELKKIIAGSDIQFSESFEVDGREMFAHACKIGLEGVVSKVRDSIYPTGRSGRDWVKKTCAQRETLTIAGFALDGDEWNGIYVGRRKGDDLIYAGKVDYGFDKASIADLRKRLTPLIRKTSPTPGASRTRRSGSSPEVLAEIGYRAKLAEGKVRHPFFRGVREDL